MRRIQIIGNLGNNCTEKIVKDSKAVHFSVCVNEKFTTKDGEKKESSYWYDCTLWVPSSRTTDYSKIFTKGSRFFIEGIPGVYTYTKGNETIAGISINVEKFVIIDIKTTGEGE